jgi:hypothetical protein
MEALLVVLGGCVLIMTVAVVAAASDLRRVARRLDAVLPAAEQALRESAHVLGRLRRLLTRTDRVAARAEGIFERACSVADEALERVTALRTKALHSLNRLIGNGHHGAGAVPRRHSRRGR